MAGSISQRTLVTVLIAVLVGCPLGCLARGSRVRCAAWDGRPLEVVSPARSCSCCPGHGAPRPSQPSPANQSDPSDCICHGALIAREASSCGVATPPDQPAVAWLCPRLTSDGSPPVAADAWGLGNGPRFCSVKSSRHLRALMQSFLI